MRAEHLPGAGGSNLYLPYLQLVARLRLALRLPRLRRGPQGPGGRRARRRRRRGCSRSSRSPTPRRPRTTITPCASWVWPRSPCGRSRATLRSRAARRPLRAQAERALDNILETTDLVDPRGRLSRVHRLHADHLGAPRAHGRDAPHPHRRGPGPPLRGLPEHGRRRTSTSCFPTARRPATTTTSTRTSTTSTASCSATRSTASRTRSRPGTCEERLRLPAKWRIPVLQFLWDDPSVVPARPGGSPPRRSCRATGSSRRSATSSCATGGRPTPPGSSSPAGRTSPSTTTSTPPTS